MGWAGTTCYMTECFDQIILGTTTDSNDVVTVSVQVRSYDARTPVGTLGLGTTTYRALCRSPRSPNGYIENERTHLAEPNPRPNHATEPADKVWTAVCSP